MQAEPLLHAHWHHEDRHRWDTFAELTLAAVHQSWSYGQAMQQLHVPCLRVALTTTDRPHPKAEEWIGAAQFIVHRLPWFSRFAFALAGPVWAPGTPVSVQRQGIELISRTLPLRRPRFALYTPPINILTPSPTTGLTTGLTTGHTTGPTTDSTSAPEHAFTSRPRLATGGSTVILDLTRSEADRRAAQEGRWRNRLNAAERSGLKVKVCGSQPSDYQWLVQAESTQRQERRYIALPEGFVQAFQAASRKPSAAVLTLAAEWDRQRCAGMMFLIHGRTATYHLGWTNEAGREHSAHNLLLWEGSRLLIERGVLRLDLGGVNTVSNPGLARFKLGTGGEVVTWAGTFL